MRNKIFRFISLGALVFPVVLFSQQGPLNLTLGDAARLAARQSEPALQADLRTREAEARVT